MPLFVRLDRGFNTPGKMIFRNLDDTDIVTVAVHVAHEEFPDVQGRIHTRLTQRSSGISVQIDVGSSVTISLDPGDEVWAAADPAHKLVAWAVSQ